MGSPFLYLCHSGQEMLLLGRSPLLPSTLISLTLLLPMVVILDTSTIDSTTWGSTVQVSRLCYDCVVVEPSEDDNSEDLVGSYRLLKGGNHSECSDSCVYVKDGGPSDEMWCFKTEQTEQNETFYNANNQCPESTIATLATALSGSTSTVSPTIVSTTARVGTSTITQKIRSSTLMSTITKGTDVTSTTADQTKITGTKLSTKDITTTGTKDTTTTGKKDMTTKGTKDTTTTGTKDTTTTGTKDTTTTGTEETTSA